MSPTTLRLYAALRRWLLTQGDGPFEWDSEAPEMGSLWLVCFRGKQYDGPTDRTAYLCLAEAEAKMVVGEVHGPSSSGSPLSFQTYLNASYAEVSLPEVLADEHLRGLLQQRLKTLASYAAEDYERATQAYWCLERGIQVILIDQGALIEPENPREQWPSNLRWKEPEVVWDEEGLAGVLGFDGQLLVPCQFASLRERLGNGRMEAVRGPLLEIHEPLEPHHMLKFLCDVIDIQTGQRINPPGVRAVRGSIWHDNEFVAVRDQDVDLPTPRLGFMDRDGHWLGKADWADLRAFSEGRAAVFCAQRQRWGYIDKHGDEVIAAQYAWAGSFNRGKALVQPHNGGEPSWLLIDLEGQCVTGPWAQIELARDNKLVVQAIEDAGSDLWSLLDESGRPLQERVAVPPDERFRQGDVDLVQEAAHHLATTWRASRGAFASSLKGLPLKERIDAFKPCSERELMQLGVWGRRVRVQKASQRLQFHGFNVGSVGLLAVYYPVSLNVFSLSEEAPVTFEREGGGDVCIGVPWGSLELVASEG